MDDFYTQRPRLARRVRAEQNPGPHDGTISLFGRGLASLVSWPVHCWRVEDVETGQVEVWTDLDFRAEFDVVVEEAPEVDAPPPPEEAPEVGMPLPVPHENPTGESPETGVSEDPPVSFTVSDR